MAMEKHYDPHSIEEKWYKTWTDKGYFHSDASADGDPYCVVIPPPNVTGILHMGHALNNTIQDILVRWRRMQGRNVVWLPGTDHAGIATQNVVERALKKEGKTREDLGREKFVERVWEWREEYGSTIINQLKRLGSSCDWERERFTMDEGLSEAVAEVFVQLYDKGLIHRANYIINWCPRCHTALSDEESEHADTPGKLYYIRYKLKSGTTQDGRDHIVVATTRPETLLGDVAIAVNPKDERYANLIDNTIILPVLGRELVIIQDDFVDPTFGTGLVKVTPAHDPNDFDMGRRHELVPINVMHGNGTMNDEAGPYAGMDRFECRKQVLKDLEAADLIEKIEDHQHAVGHCYRCDTVVEPRLSPQWFVKMKSLAEPALEAVNDGRVTFVPDRWTKVYQEWMENIRDWCISRQIWWGHRIPVFYCDDCRHEWAAKGKPEFCPKCGSKTYRQDEDVLDTWFSSWLWPFSTFGWPEENADLKCFYPTHDLVTASEIIFFWVARMVMAGIEFRGEVPFDTVYIHGTVRADDGRKMSKSLGNSIDPLTIIDEFSADALRFSLMMITATGQDIYVSNEKFEIGRNFGTKIWNAARFMQMYSEGVPAGDWGQTLDLDAALLAPDDKHILMRLNEAIEACDNSLGKYRFNDAALALYEFVWHQFCDWYVEYAKAALNGDDTGRRDQVLKIMHYCFSSAIRLLHPMMPFVTEELWHAMGYAESCETIMRAPWPTVLPAEVMAAGAIDAAAVAYVDAKHDVVRVGRLLRSDYGIAPGKRIDYMIRPDTKEAAAFLKADVSAVRAALRAETVTVDMDLKPEKAVPSAVSQLGTVYLPVENVIDVESEIKRLNAELTKITGFILNATRKLENENFVSKAPEAVVAKARANKDGLLADADKIQRLIDALEG
jgi:valyl-tRNA synthetase